MEQIDYAPFSIDLIPQSPNWNLENLETHIPFITLAELETETESLNSAALGLEFKKLETHIPFITIAKL
jgi:translation elongation factor EF-1beta